MKASEYIKQIQKLIEEHGDLKVYNSLGTLNLAGATTKPKIKHLEKGPSRIKEQWRRSAGKDAKGEKIILI